jgi:hypothetical protein
MSGDLEQQIKQLTEAYLRKADTLTHDQTAEKAPSTPEYEDKRAEAHIQAQVQFMEGTVHMERADPTWASAAEQALQEVFQHEESIGLQLVEAQCRATLCRLALSLNGATSPEESLRYLTHLVPWQGQGFAYIAQGESAEVVVYLAREGYVLPQVTE